MKVERMKVAVLVADPRNARKHDAASIEAIARSLKRFGQQKPIVVNAGNVVIAGNGTLAGAARLGWTTLNAVRSALSDEEAMAYAIADNRSAELSSWDYQVLAQSIRELEAGGFDVTETGWTPDEIVNFMGAADWTPGEAAGNPEDFSPRVPRTLRFDQAQWDRLVAALGTDKHDALIKRLLERLG